MYTNDFLDQLRLEGDPLADNAVSAIESTGQVQQVNNLMTHLIRNDQIIPHELTEPIQDFLKESSRIPAWVDSQRLERGAAFGASHGTLLLLALSTCSLVHCYAAVKGVKVLTFTHKLEHAANRRAAETAQFVLNLLSREAFSGRGHAIPVIQKVRLMHASVRYLINQSQRWPTDELGVPVCQEDLVGSLMAFSVHSLNGLRRLGIHVTSERAEDYYYLWRVAGEMMGIRPDIIPTTVDEALSLAEMIEARQCGPSPEGVELTRALLQMHQHLLPGKIYEGAMASLIRQMVGDKIADWLEIPHTRWEHVTNHIELLGHIAEKFSPQSALLQHAFTSACRAMLLTEAYALNGYRKSKFEIPADLQEAWNLA